MNEINYFEDGSLTFDQGDGTAIAALGGVGNLSGVRKAILSEKRYAILSSVKLPAVNLGTEDIAVCKHLGVDPEAYKKTLLEDFKSTHGALFTGSTHELDSEALAICKQLNIKPEDYLKTLQENS